MLWRGKEGDDLQSVNALIESKMPRAESEGDLAAQDTAAGGEVTSLGSGVSEEDAASITEQFYQEEPASPLTCAPSMESDTAVLWSSAEEPTTEAISTGCGPSSASSFTVLSSRPGSALSEVEPTPQPAS